MRQASPTIRGSDIPQSPNLARVRFIVTAIAGGITSVEQIAADADFSPRHVSYALRAAQTLGLLDRRRDLTELGRALIETAQESEAERAVLRTSVEESAVVRAVAPGLLSAAPPSKKAIASRIARLTGLSQATAEHRASDLLSWRAQLVQPEDGSPDAG